MLSRRLQVRPLSGSQKKEKIMVQFIYNKDAGEKYMELFSIAFTAEEAFHVWKMAKELNVDVCIDNVMLGNDWQARYAIEELFQVSYRLPNDIY